MTKVLYPYCDLAGAIVNTAFEDMAKAINSYKRHANKLKYTKNFKTHIELVHNMSDSVDIMKRIYRWVYSDDFNIITNGYVLSEACIRKLNLMLSDNKLDFLIKILEKK